MSRERGFDYNSELSKHPILTKIFDLNDNHRRLRAWVRNGPEKVDEKLVVKNVAIEPKFAIARSDFDRLS